MSGKTALRIMKTIKGERIAGSAEERKAIKSIAGFCRQHKSKTHTYKCPLYVSKPGKGIVKSGKTVIKGRPFSLSVPFNVKGVLMTVNSADKLNNISTDIRGKILLMRERPAPKTFPELKKRGIKGIILASRTDGRLGSYHLTQKNVKDKCLIPFMDITYDDAVVLMENEGRNIEMKGEGRTFKVEATNLVADVKGTLSDETIAVMGHIDSVPFSPGASDNSGGIGIMCELLEYFSRHPVKRNIRFLFFSAEEWGLLGSKAYVSKKSNLKDIICGVNIDVAGDKLGVDRCVVTANDKLVDFMNMLNKFHGLGFTCSKDIYSSDNMPFSDNGIPTVNMFRVGGKPSAFVHTENDSMEYVSHEGLGSIVDMARHLIEMAGNAEQNIIEKKIDDTVKEKIANYFSRSGGK